MSDNKKIVLKTSVGWAGCDTTMDITEWYEGSGCKSIDDFCEKYKENILDQAIQEQSFEYWVEEEE